jgi:hypothetical protein
MELARLTKYNLDISSESELFTYTYDGEETREVLIRINLGDASKPIAGAGTYTLRPSINGVPVSPVASVTVAAGVTKTVLISRIIPLEDGDELKLQITGRPADTSVNAVVSIRDMTALRADELTGAGDVPVDHNYGGANALAYRTSAGRGVDGATILVYTRSDYDAGNRSADKVVARGQTTTDGKWAGPLMLNAGSYTLVFYKTGLFGPDRVDLTVA